MKYTETIILDLKKARQKKGWSQQVLAEKLGLPQSHISKIESGKISPTISNVIQIARVLNLELMAVPAFYVGAIQSLCQPTTSYEQKPAYTLDDEEEEDENVSY